MRTWVNGSMGQTYNLRRNTSTLQGWGRCFRADFVVAALALAIALAVALALALAIALALALADLPGFLTTYLFSLSNALSCVNVALACHRGCLNNEWRQKHVHK